MRAAVVERYGSLEVQDVEKPAPAAGELLVQVHATSLNAVDWYGFSGRPYAARPLMGLRSRGPAASAATSRAWSRPSATTWTTSPPATRCTAARAGVRRVRRRGLGGRAEAGGPLVRGGRRRAARRASALQGLRDHGGSRRTAGLVNGASGGVGTFAVQIAKALGAEVHAVCSTRNVEQARELGADRVFDYTREDYTRGGARYDVLFDNAGNRSWRRCAGWSRRTARSSSSEGRGRNGCSGRSGTSPASSSVEARCAERRLLHREAEPCRSRDPARPDRGRAGAARDRAALRARADRGGDARDR